MDRDDRENDLSEIQRDCSASMYLFQLLPGPGWKARIFLTLGAQVDTLEVYTAKGGELAHLEALRRLRFLQSRGGEPPLVRFLVEAANATKAIRHVFPDLTSDQLTRLLVLAPTSKDDEALLRPLVPTDEVRFCCVFSSRV